MDGMLLFLILSPLLGAALVAIPLWRARRRAAAEQAARAQLLEAIETVPAQFALFDRDRRLIASSAAYRRLYREAFEPLDPPIRQEASDDESFDRLGADGQWVRVTRKRMSSGAVADFALDITPLKTREAELAASEARFSAMVDDTPIGIWQLDAAGRTLFANARLAGLLGGSVPETIAEASFGLPASDDPAHPFGFEPGRRIELILPQENDLTCCLLLVASPWILDAMGSRSVLLTLMDISSLKSAQAQLEHMARHDPLTGLGNRDHFRAALDAMIRAGGGALVLLDLDNFKEANDRHGHEAGDALLVGVAERLRAAVRPEDTVCRLDGDEFALLVRGVDADVAMTIAARAARLAAEPVGFGSLSMRITASTGVALAPLHGATAADLLRAADLTLQESKMARRGEPEMFRRVLRDQADQRLRVRGALAPALAAGELRLAFQPQRDLSSRALLGAEALLRWNSTALGREVGPVELLEAAAEARLLPEIDEWVVAEAIARLADWRGEPEAPPTLAINVSTLSLRDPSLADRVARQLLAAGVEPERLEIEVPESIAVRDIEAVRPTLERLNSVGVRLALDDYGAGLSSLQHVVSLPVDRLKLDRSITAHLDGPEPPRAVLRATLALARSMGIEVLAEGVETEAQAFALRREGISLAQGWLTGRPVEVENLFERRRQLPVVERLGGRA